jgi:hypothetical protein
MAPDRSVAQFVDCGDPIERLSPATTARKASSPEFPAWRPEPAA